MPKDTNYEETLRTRISTRMLERLEQLAGNADDSRPVSDLVRDAIREYLRREEGRCEKCGQEKSLPATGRAVDFTPSDLDDAKEKQRKKAHDRKGK
jgi:Arc/MetJ-type ribon-helix-helix transcriptional regulator